jgi:ribokinase
MMNRRIVVLGSVNIDMVLRCPQLPRPGQTVLGDDFRTLPGGKGANQAVAAARLDAQVSLIACVGDDDFGRAARVLFELNRVDTLHLHSVAGASTGVAMILVEASGQNCITLASGANALLSVAQVEAAAPLIGAAALLVCQLETPLHVVSHAIAIAHAAGVPVLLNPAPAQALPPELLARVDVLVPNESEAAQLVGLPADAVLDPAAAASALRQLGPRTVIITLGAGGVQVADGEHNLRLPAPVVDALDTTGAGDTFVGAYAAAVCRGAGLLDAVAYAQRAAALSVTKAGAIDAMPTQEQLRAAFADLA